MMRRQFLLGGLAGFAGLHVTARAGQMSRFVRLPSRQSPGIGITAPTDGELVAARSRIEGTIPTAGTEIWVVIHPMIGGDFWVQLPTRSRGQRWTIAAAFGEPGREHRGQSYEVMAFAGPTQRLRPGMVLGDWPSARHVSGMIQVTRA